MPPDQSIEVLIKTVLDGKDGALSIKQQKDLAEAIRKTGDVSTLSVRQFNELERAAKRAGAAAAEAFEKLNSNSTGKRGGSYSPLASGYDAPIGPSAYDFYQQQAEAQRRVNDKANAARRGKGKPPRADGEEDGHGLGHNMRRHWGAVAGQALGMPGLGMAVSAGGVAAMLGGAVIILEKMVRFTNEWIASARRFAEIGHMYAVVGDYIKSAAANQRSLNRETALFELGLAAVDRNARNVATTMEHIGTLRETEARWRIEIEDRGRALEHENILLQTRFNALERLRRLAEFDKDTARITAARQAEDEQRKIDLLNEQIRLAQKRGATAKEWAEIDKQVIAAETHDVAVQAEDANVAKATAKARYDAYEKQRLALEFLKSGSFSARGDYMDSVSGLEQAGEKGTLNSKVMFAQLYSQLNMGALAVGHVTPMLNDAIEARLKEVRGKQKELSGLGLAADGNVEAAGQPLKAAQEKLEENKTAIREAREAAAKARVDLQTLEKEKQLREQSAPESLRQQGLEIDTRTKREILESIQPQNISVPGGGVNVGNAELLKAVETLAVKMDDLKQIWTTGSPV
jgi:hypothetical protein